MRKEVLFAIVIGSLVGLVTAFGVWKANRNIKNNNSQAQSPTQPPSLKENEDTNNNSGLTVVSPLNNSVTSEDTISVLGYAGGAEFIVVSASDSTMATVDSNGEYSAEVPLESGANQITVSAIAQSGTVNQHSLLVIRNDSASEGHISYVGLITDIAEETLQIKDMAGEIKLISVSADANYKKHIDKEEDISFSDVAIGDFVVATGMDSENDVLSAETLIVTEPYEPKEVTVIYGDIAESSDDELVVNWKDEQKSITAAKNVVTRYADNKSAKEDFDEIDEAVEIIAVGTQNENQLAASVVFILD